MHSGRYGSGTSSFGTTFLKCQTVGCQTKEILPYFVYFFPSRDPYALWTKFRSHFVRACTQNLLTEAEEAALLQTGYIKQNGLQHEGLGLLILNSVHM